MCKWFARGSQERKYLGHFVASCSVLLASCHLPSCNVSYPALLAIWTTEEVLGPQMGWFPIGAPTQQSLRGERPVRSDMRDGVHEIFFFV